MPSFEDLRAFQLALDLMVDVYTATEVFPKHEMYGLTSQLRRAACSVVSNIAEGQGRLTYGERRQLFSHARGSLFEIQAQLLAASRLRLIDVGSAEHLKVRTSFVGRELAGLIDWIKRRETETRASKRKNP
jgi:four helix bundle protein